MNFSMNKVAAPPPTRGALRGSSPQVVSTPPMPSVMALSGMLKSLSRARLAAAVRPEAAAAATTPSQFELLGCRRAACQRRGVGRVLDHAPVGIDHAAVHRQGGEAEQDDHRQDD
jgi:hypothetical protein